MNEPIERRSDKQLLPYRSSSFSSIYPSIYQSNPERPEPRRTDHPILCVVFSHSSSPNNRTASCVLRAHIDRDPEQNQLCCSEQKSWHLVSIRHVQSVFIQLSLKLNVTPSSLVSSSRWQKLLPKVREYRYKLISHASENLGNNYQANKHATHWIFRACLIASR